MSDGVTIASERLAAYQRMRPPRSCAEAVTTAQLLGLDPDAVSRIEAEWHGHEDDTCKGSSEYHEADPLPLAVCALNAPPPQALRWAVRELIPAGEIGLIASDGGVGKTTLALHIAGALAGNYSVVNNPRFTSTGGPVLIVSEEDPASVLLNRLEALAAGHGWERNRVFGNIHLFALAGVKLTDPRWQLHLLAEVGRIQPVAIVFDPLFEITNGHEDSNTEQRPTVQFCRLLCRPSEAAVIILMHFGKAAEGKRKIDRLRGASAWYNAARFAFALEEREGGMLVECLKMSRAVKPLPFVLERQVTTDAANEGIWVSASLCHRTPHAAELDRAERWVLKQLTDSGTRLNTTDLKHAARGSGISAADVSGAINRLQTAGRIAFEEGSNRAHLWGVTHLPATPGNLPGEQLPDLPDAGPASGRRPMELAHPLRGQASHGPAGKRHAQQPFSRWPGPCPRCDGALRQRASGAYACPDCKGERADDPFRRLPTTEDLGEMTPELRLALVTQ